MKAPRARRAAASASPAEANCAVGSGEARKRNRSPCARVSTVAALFALGVAACGHAPSARLPGAVQARVAALAAECLDAGGTPQSEDAVRSADFTGDGHEDFVLYAGWLACDGAAGVFGDREKALTVFVGDANGDAAEAFGDAVYDVKTESAPGGAPELWLTVSAEGCGQPRAKFFSEESFCDRALLFNAAGQRFDYAPVGTVRMIR